MNGIQHAGGYELESLRAAIVASTQRIPKAHLGSAHISTRFATSSRERPTVVRSASALAAGGRTCVFALTVVTLFNGSARPPEIAVAVTACTRWSRLSNRR